MKKPEGAIVLKKPSVSKKTLVESPVIGPSRPPQIAQSPDTQLAPASPMTITDIEFDHAASDSPGGSGSAIDIMNVSVVEPAVLADGGDAPGGGGAGHGGGGEGGGLAVIVQVERVSERTAVFWPKAMFRATFGASPPNLVNVEPFGEGYLMDPRC